MYHWIWDDSQRIEHRVQILELFYVNGGCVKNLRQLRVTDRPCEIKEVLQWKITNRKNILMVVIHKRTLILVVQVLLKNLNFNKMTTQVPTEKFIGRVISRYSNWLPRSCNLALLDCFLWGYVKKQSLINFCA